MGGGLYLLSDMLWSLGLQQRVVVSIFSFQFNFGLPLSVIMVILI